MRKFTVPMLVFVLLLALILAVPALAGGWAVVTLDSLPGPLTSGQPLAVGFTIRQHGQTPWVYDGVRVEATHIESGQMFAAQARAEGPAGHYVAELNLPVAGAWRWGVVSGLYPDIQPMPDLTVTEGGAAPAASGLAQTSSPLRFPLPAVLSTLAGLAILTVSAWALARRRSGRGLALALLVLAIALIGFAAAPRLSRAEAPAVQEQAAAVLPEPDAQHGETLFIAKGCVVCHTQPAAQRRITIETQDVGIDLTKITYSPEYLRVWLADPKAVKPNTYMPDLDLSPAEIDALVTYLDAGKE